MLFFLLLAIGFALGGPWGIVAAIVLYYPIYYAFLILFGYMGA